MRPFQRYSQRKLRVRHIIESWPFLFVLSLAAIFLAFVVVGFFDKMGETVKNKQVAAAKVAELEKGKVKLAHDIDKLNTESGVEESIREKFGLAKEGEGLIIVVDDKEQGEAKEKENRGGFFSFLFFWRN